jgi:hypothetical protein
MFELSRIVLKKMIRHAQVLAQVRDRALTRESRCIRSLANRATRGSGSTHLLTRVDAFGPAYNLQPRRSYRASLMQLSRDERVLTVIKV